MDTTDNDRFFDNGMKFVHRSASDSHEEAQDCASKLVPYKRGVVPEVVRKPETASSTGENDGESSKCRTTRRNEVASSSQPTNMVRSWSNLRRCIAVSAILDQRNSSSSFRRRWFVNLRRCQERALSGIADGAQLSCVSRLLRASCCRRCNYSLATSGTSSSLDHCRSPMQQLISENAFEISHAQTGTLGDILGLHVEPPVRCGMANTRCWAVDPMSKSADVGHRKSSES